MGKQARLRQARKEAAASQNTNLDSIIKTNAQNPGAQTKTRILAWGATPFVITGFGVVMKEILKNLFSLYPGVYDICQVAINYHGDHCEENAITGGEANGRFRQWPAAVQVPNMGMNLYGQQKFLEVLSKLDFDFDIIFLFEDPFWVGGHVPGANPPALFMDAIKNILASRGKSHIPIISYFPIDGIPKQLWIDNLAKSDIPITYLNFGATECLNRNHTLRGRIGVIPHGVNSKEFFPIPKQEARLFKRAMFGERFTDRFMLLNVNRNQLRKLVPSSLLAFKQFKEKVPESFLYLNMMAVDVGWNLPEVCQTLGLRIGEDVIFPNNFSANKGLDITDLNKLFNVADVLITSAVGGGWELAISQAFATKTTVLAPANTSHIELCGDQNNPQARRGILYKSGSNLAQTIIFPSDNEVPRPLPDVDDMVEKLLWIYSNQKECREMEEIAYKWTQDELQWDKHIAPKFHNAFELAKKIKDQKLQQLTKGK